MSTCQTRGMAVHHPATIVPSKLELLQAWVPHQPWLSDADTSTLTKLGSYRFDDPDGEVGIETHLLGTADGQVFQVPLTYRGTPRASAEQSLITTMTHTTLGDRWIYDACDDPVYVTALATADAGEPQVGASGGAGARQTCRPIRGLGRGGPRR
jgi:hypothetical protein